MPLIHSKSKPAFEHNLKAELNAGKPMKQSLAIAYNTRRHMKKSKGGMIENESLDPMHNDPDSLATADIDHLSMDKHDQSHGQLPHPAEPKEHVMPGQEDMARENPIGDRIMRAVNMAMGGRVDEHEGESSGEEANRSLAMNDTYPPGPAESDTQAQDEGFGEGSMDNEEMPDDQEKARRRMSRALEMSRRGARAPIKMDDSGY